ncbi:hypothetical protein D3C71_1836690 [compost metagenome]
MHTLDVLAASEAVEAGRWTPREVRAEDLPRQYGYTMSPQARWEANGRPKAPPPSPSSPVQ